MTRTEKTTVKKQAEPRCQCVNSTSVYTVNGEWGYWLYCSDCKKPLEDEFHYYDEPELD